jgi:dihydroorotase
MPNSTLLIKNGQIINRGVISFGDIFIKNDRIEKIASTIDIEADTVIDATGKWVIPGIIDDQVHFREPGMTYKADIASESRAAIAGGVTTFMEMPNTMPSALTQELLQDKYDIAYRSAYSNYSFFMGASNENIEDVLKTNPQSVCGVKVFMGSSTGNMLVDNEKVLNNIFSNVDMLIATHCEDEATIRANMAAFQEKYGNNLNATHHPLIRNTEGCLISSTLASTLAKKHNTRLHILHISTAEEIALFTNKIPLAEKRITSEACVHHMYFTADDYSRLGNKIKCNPAIKAAHNRDAIRAAVIDGTIDTL